MGAKGELLQWVDDNVSIPKYMDGGDGKTYLIRSTPGGGEEYVEAEASLRFERLPSGRLASVRDLEELGRAHGRSSHRDHFGVLGAKEQRLYKGDGVTVQLDGLVDQDPAKARQRMKRQDKLQEQFERMAITRIAPTGSGGLKIERITDEKALDLMREWQGAAARGVQKDSDFQPALSYAEKLRRYNVRQVFQGEVGTMMSTGTILVLQAGYGTGNFAAVPEAMGGGQLVTPAGHPIQVTTVERTTEGLSDQPQYSAPVVEEQVLYVDDGHGNLVPMR